VRNDGAENAPHRRTGTIDVRSSSIVSDAETIQMRKLCVFAARL
jgi:hypothetical protein